MSAYLELRQTGKLGTAGAQLLYDTAAAVVRFDRLPPPDGAAWRRDDVRELAHEFLADGRTPKRLAVLLLRATDDDTLARMLEAAVRNFVRDRARRTDHGAFRRRLKEVLADAPGVRRVETPRGEAWTVATIPDDAEVYAGEAAALDGAAWSIEAPVVRWRSEARRSPVTDAAALVAVAEAVIEEAGGPVMTTTLVEVGLRRFALSAAPLVLDLDSDPPATEGLPEEIVGDRLMALEAFTQLSERERLILTVWDRPIREVGDVVGLGHSAAAVAVKRLEALLTELLDQQSDADTVWHELQHLAHAWVEHRTPGGGASYEQGRRGDSTT